MRSSKKRKVLIGILIFQLAALAALVPVFLYTIQLDPVTDLNAKASKAGTVQLNWKHEGPYSYYLISVRSDGKKYGDKVYKTQDTEFTFQIFLKAIITVSMYGL